MGDQEINNWRAAQRRYLKEERKASRRGEFDGPSAPGKAYLKALRRRVEADEQLSPEDIAVMQQWGL